MLGGRSLVVGRAAAEKLMVIPVHDHLILAGSDYTSLAERGLM